MKLRKQIYTIEQLDALPVRSIVRAISEPYEDDDDAELFYPLYFVKVSSDKFKVVNPNFTRLGHFNHSSKTVLKDKIMISLDGEWHEAL